MTAPKEGTPRRRNSRIPEFASIQDEAEWWDSHDIADYQDELKTVDVRFARKLSDSITIRLDAETLAELRSRALQQGVPPAALARTWVLEHLHDDEQRPTAASR
jgi:predicted DNA binding CopG/RHH family protein